MLGLYFRRFQTVLRMWLVLLLFNHSSRDNWNIIQTETLHKTTLLTIEKAPVVSRHVHVFSSRTHFDTYVVVGVHFNHSALLRRLYMQYCLVIWVYCYVCNGN